MKGFGGLKPLEIGQSVKKAIGDDAKKTLQSTQAQITGKPVNGQATSNPMTQANVPDGMGDISKLLETNQGQQNQSYQQPQPQQPVNFETKYAAQHTKEQAELAAARKNIQQIEEEMEKYRQERRQKEQQEEVKEEQKKDEALWQKEQEKKQPINAGQRSGESKGGNKG